MHVLRIDAAAEQGGDPQVVTALPPFPDPEESS